ncbi:predicted protein, partial [Arabidopsis lyrata subsp. lyrata]
GRRRFYTVSFPRQRRFTGSLLISGNPTLQELLHLIFTLKSLETFPTQTQSILLQKTTTTLPISLSFSSSETASLFRR